MNATKQVMCCLPLAPQTRILSEGARFALAFSCMHVAPV